MFINQGCFLELLTQLENRNGMTFLATKNLSKILLLNIYE